MLGAIMLSGAMLSVAMLRVAMLRVLMLCCCFGANIIKLFVFVIKQISYLAGVFVTLGWKSLPQTNTIAYYENS
jgi:hypothetical protein